MSTRGAGTARTSRPRSSSAPKPMSQTTRKTLATQEIMRAVGATTTAEKDSAITAALEAVKEHLLPDSGYREALRQRYEELRALSQGGSKKAELGPMPQPKPSARLAGHNPLARLNPYEIADAYEHSDFRAVLEHSGRDLLREMVGVVMARTGAKKAPNRNSPQAMMDFITLHVLGPGF